MTSLPNNWVLARVDEVAILGPRNYLDEDLEVGFIPLNLLGTKFNDTPRFEVRKWHEVRQGFTHLADGDVVIAKITPSFENGKSGVVRGLPNGVGAGSTEYFVCRPINGGVQPHFLLAFLKTKKFNAAGKQQMSGAVGQQRVPKDFLASAQIPLPPVSEQKRIVRKLHSIFRGTDKCVLDAAELAARAKRYERNVLDAAIRGSLTSDWRKLHPEAESGTQRRDRILAAHAAMTGPFKNAVESDLESQINAIGFEIPDSWCWLAGVEVVAPGAEIVYGIVQPGPKQDEGVPYVRGMDIEDDRIIVDQLAKTTPEIAARYSRSSLAAGDVLLGIIRATKVATVPQQLEGGNITQGTCRLRPSKFLLSEYLAIALRSPSIQKWLHNHFRGIDMPGLNLADVRRVPIPIPSISEQKEIIAQVQKHNRTARAIASFAMTLTERARFIEESVLERAFRGDLIVPSGRGKIIRLEEMRSKIESEIHAEQMRRKTWRTRPMKSITLEDVRAAITAMPKKTFSSDELQRRTSLEYEVFKEFLFELLGEADSPIEQYFDATAAGVYLRKVQR